MYQALYRKYRPRDFESLIGQDHITSILKNQIDTGKISHAYLFSGTRGTGKTSAAKIFARAVNCTGEYKPCSTCPSCIESLEESTVDIIEIDAASNNGVDNIRDIRDRAFYQPASLKYKVYIIDEVHMLSKGAFNALLKILEEPPKHLIFILATTEPERIPLTILSRVQKFQFNRINSETIKKRLAEIAELESKKIDEEVLRLIIARSDGSMRDALSILDQLFTLGSDTITYDTAVESLGIVGSGTLFKLVDGILYQKGEWIDILDDTLSAGKDIQQLSVDILEHFRRLMIAKVSPDSLSRYVYSNNQEYINQSKNINLEYITRAMNILVDNINNSRYSQQKRALLEIAILEIISIGQIKQQPIIEESSVNKVNRAEDLSVPKKETKTEDITDINKTKEHDLKEIEIASHGEESDGATDITIERIQSDWTKILNEIEKITQGPMASIIKKGSPSSYEDKTLTIGFHPDDKDLLEMGSRYTENIEKILDMLYNKNDLKAKLEVLNSTDKSNNIDEEKERLINLCGNNVKYKD